MGLFGDNAAANCRASLWDAGSLLSNKNKNARRQREKIEEKNGRAKINAKTHEAINNQVNRD